MAAISIRLDDQDKKNLDALCAEMGMSLNTFFTIYAKTALRQQRIPFIVSAQADPFYSASNMKALDESDRQYREGKVVVKTVEELEALADA